jgi:hypothetical protein
MTSAQPMFAPRSGPVLGDERAGAVGIKGPHGRVGRAPLRKGYSPLPRTAEGLGEGATFIP